MPTIEFFTAGTNDTIAQIRLSQADFDKVKAAAFEARKPLADFVLETVMNEARKLNAKNSA